MSGADVLRAIVAGNRAGKACGIAAWCTAHPQTLRAVLRAHHGSDDPVLIEATCNQVNQDGGYTGMTPAGFRALIETLALEAGIDMRRVILGGDHLGPNPWKHLPAAEAMAKASAMVQGYAQAGFEKIHLDASMACADDGALPEATMAARAAELCAVAEAARGGRAIVYIIGTEVPVPGGETQAFDALAVTRPEAARRTVALHRAAFAARGLDSAFARVIGVVAQPGVDFGNAQVFAFDKARAADLSAAARDMPGAVFEAHSTDYQSGAALADLVASHFAILKVGPALTFAFREAVVAMAAIEERLKPANPSHILAAIEDVMDADPRHWRGYAGAGEHAALTRLYGLSDRVRYYWPDARIAAALETLSANIAAARVPPGLVSQFCGTLLLEYSGMALAEQIVHNKVGAEIAKYRKACGALSRRE